MTGRDARCPRCGGAFHCGAKLAQASDAPPCACTSVTLDAQTLAELRARYAACLCLACLRELARAHEKAGPV